ncbi:uncharacterized protein [Porites lutea]|uniref:uncharacterized protein n=1 Tax=Porites lutea TaxID=51062 RepID=UPI003CC52999
METGNAQQKLTERATTEEDHIIARDAAFSQSCGEVGTLRDELEHEYLNIVNSATNDDRNSNNDLADDNKHEQSDDELDFILPSPPTESPEPSKDSNPTNNGLDRFKCPDQAKSTHDKLDGRLPHPPSTSNSGNDGQEQTDVLERPRIRNELSKDQLRANIFKQPAGSLGPCYGPLPDDQTNRTTENINTASSSLSERDSYMWSLGSVDLPSMLALNDGVERLLWPAEEEFPDHNGFEEGKDYVLITRVGEGAFGECFMAVELPYDKEREFCVKKCQLKDINELLVLTLARKESVAEIVQFYGAKLKGKSASIFMEFMKGGTIAELFEDEKKNCAKAVGVVSSPPVISEIYCLWYLENVLRALVFLHKKGIVHRDVKGLNVLLPEDRRNAKLADFGSAENRKNMGTFIDIWKTGCFFLEMWNGERPSSLLALTEGGSVHPQRQTSCRPEDHIPLSASNETKELLRLCFGVNNEEHGNLPSAAELLKKLESFPAILSRTV